MITIFIKKIFAYDPTFNGTYSKYEGYRKITRQEQSPGIKKQHGIEKTTVFSGPIYSSVLRRGEESGEVYADRFRVPFITTPLLNEIRFDLHNLVTENEFEEFGSSLVRERFIMMFEENGLLERRDEIQYRIERLMMLLKNNPEGKYLLVSHSFFMKLLETYLHEPDLFEHPELLKRTFDNKMKTYEFGEGFTFMI